MLHSEAEHIKGKDPVVAKVYKPLIAELRKFDPLKIEPKMTSVHLANRFGFAGVYTRKSYINLEVHRHYKLTGERISKVEQGLPTAFTIP